MRIMKVKYSGERVLIDYEKQAKGDEWDHFSIDCSEAPKASLTDALQALKEYVVAICEYPKEMIESVKVIGVSFSYKGELSIMGAVVIATKKVKLTPSPMILNTPFLSSIGLGKNKTGPAMRDGDLELFESVQTEAVAYINGERAQMQLFKAAGRRSSVGAPPKGSSPSNK